MQFPDRHLVLFLDPGNSVTLATKEKISAFLNANATRLHDEGVWLRPLPKGAEKWLKPIALAGLQHEKNKVRRRAAAVLREAGEVAALIERPPARYRLFVDEQLWRSERMSRGYRHLGLNVTWHSLTHPGGLATSVDPDRDGVISVDPDHLIPLERVRAAHFYAAPDTISKPTRPDQPWIRAEIPLPPIFGETRDIRVTTVPVEIRPQFPRPPRDYEGAITKVGFTWAKDDRIPNDSSHVYHITGSEPLALSKVQPGEYWLQVRAPGAARAPWEKIRVSENAHVFQPKLTIGANVTVPLNWPKDLKVETLDPEIAGFFYRQRWAGLDAFFSVERDGKPFPEALPGLSEERQQAESKTDLELSNLPVGKYRVCLRSSDEIAKQRALPKAERSYPGWKRAELTFEVNSSSPAKFRVPAMEVEMAP